MRVAVVLEALNMVDLTKLVVLGAVEQAIHLMGLLIQVVAVDAIDLEDQELLLLDTQELQEQLAER
jgi:hypothetical protein